jgi:hypothetical protein
MKITAGEHAPQRNSINNSFCSQHTKARPLHSRKIYRIADVAIPKVQKRSANHALMVTLIISRAVHHEATASLLQPLQIQLTSNRICLGFKMALSEKFGTSN